MAVDNKLLRGIYTLFLGIIFAVFVGMAINTFYIQPKSPTYPETTYKAGEYTDEQINEQTRLQTIYTNELKAYDATMNQYSRNVSIIALGSAVFLIVLSVIYEKRMKIIADGMMLGGLFTLLYSIIRSFMSENSRYTFIAVSVGLAVVIYLGYARFVRVTKPKNIKK